MAVQWKLCDDTGPVRGLLSEDELRGLIKANIDEVPPIVTYGLSMDNSLRIDTWDGPITGA